MLHFLQFSLLQRLGSLAAVMLLTPSMLVIPATAQASPRPLRTGAACTGAEVLQPNDPDVQALRSLIQKFKLTTPAEVAEQPIKQLQFIHALEKVLGELQQKTTAKQISLTQKDWLTVFNLTQRFASDSIIIGNIQKYAYDEAAQSAQGKIVSAADLQALQTLAQKYGSPYPSMRSRGGITRYEFAAGLNATLDRINELIASGNAAVVLKSDLQILQRLQEEYTVELAALRGRIDALEARTATLERQQFSTTTKLAGEVILPITAAPVPNPAFAVRPVPSPSVSANPAPVAAPPLAGNIAVQSLGQAQTRQATPGKPLPPIDASSPSPTGLSPQDRTNRPGTGNTEGYNPINENPFLRPSSNPLSTFSIDLDTASYSNVRRFITQGQLPPKDAVRIEEMINYFPYDYSQPEGDKPFSITTDVAAAPWNPKHKLVQIGLKGKQLQKAQPSNLVFLVDVSGSMAEPNKLPLVKQSLCLLVNELSASDRVTLVVYAGNAGLVLPPTPGDQKQKILDAIDQLEAGGSTAGGEGIELAYKMAQQNFLKDGNNRVILATDGDFNVGVSSDAELVRLIEQKRDRGIFLTVLGFGTGNYKDAKMEQLADKGNGNYAYIDTLLEAKKVLVNDLRGTLFAIAKDVKIQVEFNPTKVQAYRLIGYENRLLRDQDFNDDTKDAGEIGAGHTVTALYEVIPTGIESDVKLPSVDPLKYQQNPPVTTSTSDELMQVKLRYKNPKDSTSQLISQSILDRNIQPNSASNNLKFSAAVVMFGMLLRDSEFKGRTNFDTVLQLANQAKGKDQEGYRSELISLVDRCKNLLAQQKGTENANNDALQRNRL